MKPLTLAKSRLGSFLKPKEREGLVLAMLWDVLDAIAKSEAVDQCLVISPDSTVLEAANKRGFSGLMEEHQGNLNGALTQATDWCISHFAKALLILPGDLPFLVGEDVKRLFSYLSGERTVVISPCRRGEGTNALLRSPPNVIPTLFGKGSFEAHLRRARELGIRVYIASSEGLSFDIDTVEDLQELFARKDKCQAHTRSFLERMSRFDPASGPSSGPSSDPAATPSRPSSPSSSPSSSHAFPP
jgi:2-phospho-L-lactate guanylyltransferase